MKSETKSSAREPTTSERGSPGDQRQSLAGRSPSRSSPCCCSFSADAGAFEALADLVWLRGRRIALILLMAGVSLGGNRPRWLRFERAAMLGLATALLALTFVVAAFLVAELLYQPTKFAGQQLLTAGIEVVGHECAGVLDRLLGHGSRRSGKSHEANPMRCRTGFSPKPEFRTRSRPTGDRPMSITCFSPFRPPRPSAPPTSPR